jgi:FkbM family methyltransferase
MRDIVLRGRPLRLTDDKPTFWAQAAAGAWEPGTLTAIEEAVGPGCVFLDVGAWVGPTALYAAALGATVVALEADPVAFAALEGNVAANPRLGARMTLIHAAAAPSPGTVQLGAPRKLGDSMGSTLLAGRTEQGFSAPAMTPAMIAAVLPDAPLVLKIDIEGGEYALLPALDPLLPRLRLALVAFHPALLREIATTETAMRHQNDQAFQVFRDFIGRPIDDKSKASTQDGALRQNGTVRFDRESGL